MPSRLAGSTAFLVYSGNADGTFRATSIDTTVVGGLTGNNSLHESTFLGDVTGSGTADWIHGIETGGGDTELRLVRSLGDGTFDTVVTTTTLVGEVRAGGWSSDSESTYAGDVDGDGLFDWVHAIEAGGDTTFYTYLGNAGGTFDTTSVNTVVTGGFAGNNPMTESTYIADVDGDSRADWVHGIETGGDTELYVFLGQSDGSFAAAINTTLAGVGRSGNVSMTESTFVGDITGDGLADWVHALEDSGDTTFYVARGTSAGTFLASVSTVFAGVGRAGNDSLFEASFIAAPKARSSWIHGIESGGSTFVFSIRGNGDGSMRMPEVGTVLPGIPRSGGFGSDTESTSVGDVDGDGIIDWVHAFESGGDTSIFTFTGNANGTFDSTSIDTVVTGSHTGNNSLSESTFLGDVTGDGSPDWIHGIETGGGDTELRVARSLGDGTFETTVVVTTLTAEVRAGGWSSDSESTFVGDVNGDGYTDWVHAIETGGIETSFYTYLGQANGSFNTVSVDTAAVVRWIYR